MMQATQADKLLHTCSVCDKKFYLRFDSQFEQQNQEFLYKANCPYCSNLNYVKYKHSPWIQTSVLPHPALPVQHFEVPTRSSLKIDEKEKYQEKIRITNTTDVGTIKRQRKKHLRFTLRSLMFGLPCLGPFFFLLWLFSLSVYPSLYLSEDTSLYLERLRVNQPNRILDSEGQLVAELFTVKTNNLKADQIPRSIKDIIVFTEDQEFYQHGGVYLPAIFRAFLHNVFALGYVQGGSTITQQLARILLANNRKSLSRKFREAALAHILEDRLSKEEILAAYLSFVYLGHGTYGIENAARFYFDKSLYELSFSEQLILACLLSAPERYSPLRHSEGLSAKMHKVSLRMKEEAFLLLPENYDEQNQKTLNNINRSPMANVYADRTDHAPYVTELIRQEIKQVLGEEYMYNAGLVIKTSLDVGLQKASVLESKKFIARHAPRFPPLVLENGKVIKDTHLKRLQKQVADVNIALLLMGLPQASHAAVKLQTASIGIANRSGHILFMQGGTEFSPSNQFNRAIHMYRQTGSTIKPIIYALAIQDGLIHTASLLDDRPIFVNVEPQDQDDKDYWNPSNYNGVYEGKISVRRALTMSQNVPAIRVTNLLGMSRLRTGFSRFFFPDSLELEKRFRADSTIGIGSLEMSPIEMALAYSAFANNGWIESPRLILSISDAQNNNELYNRRLHNSKIRRPLGLSNLPRRKVLDGDVAEIMVSLLRGATRRSGIHWKDVKGLTFVGKTGTSNDYRDAWFIGFTPEITTVVWVGFDQPRYSMSNQGTGSRLAGPLWGRIMHHAQSDRQAKFEYSPRARAKQICLSTGRLYSSTCPVPPQRELFRSTDNLKALLTGPNANSKASSSTRESQEASGQEQLLNVDSDF